MLKSYYYICCSKVFFFNNDCNGDPQTPLLKAASMRATLDSFSILIYEWKTILDVAALYYDRDILFVL